MKFMKRFLILMFCLMSFVGINAQTFDIDKRDLDESIIVYVEKHFPNNKIVISVVEAETHRPSSKVDEYEIILDNDVKLEFDRKFRLKSIDGHGVALPTSVLPSKIRNYINRKYPNVNVTEYSIDNDWFRNEYDVELSNGIELKFNSNYKLIELD